MESTMIFHKSILGLLTVLLAASLLISGCETDQKSLPEQSAVSVDIVEAEQRTIGMGQIVPALVESRNQAELSTIVMGTVTQTDVNVGDRVLKDDVLVRIKDDQIRAQKMQLEANKIQAQANLSNTEKNYNRIKNLYAEESATSKELDDISTMYEIAKANMDALEASLREVNEMLSYTIIRAPFDGIVSRKYVEAGDMASPGHPLVSVADPGQIKFTANIPERMIQQVSEGMKITIDVPAAGLLQAEAEIYAVSGAGDRASRQFAVEARLMDQSQAPDVRTGMFAEMNIHLNNEGGLFIPKSALIERGQLTGILTMSDDNLALLRWVRVGRTSGDDVEILSGLKPGEEYVHAPGQSIRQGQLLSAN
jgi:RND family efflux transporter MFP subunit